ncbi:unnamed protein product [Rangifer tarandus platyrhynchus]|uniref:Uncharacterized protein n=1 Tax=Rangifer tarandus platyrhynchus TaxID=3082113 RepID=A0ABN9A185_RANTA|nr:unnamed protein product [Rangifer tarandus platyrhynchus]
MPNAIQVHCGNVHQLYLQLYPTPALRPHNHTIRKVGGVWSLEASEHDAMLQRESGGAGWRLMLEGWGRIPRLLQWLKQVTSTSARAHRKEWTGQMLRRENLQASSKKANGIYFMPLENGQFP